MVCIRVVPQEDEPLWKLVARIDGTVSEYRESDTNFFLQLVKPTSVAVPSKLALLRDGVWTVGTREVRSALGLPQPGYVTVDPHMLPKGDEVYLHCKDTDWSLGKEESPVPAVMCQMQDSLHRRLAAEQAVRTPEREELPGPSPAVLCAFISKLACHEIAIVEEIEDYLYYHVLVADHVKYFAHVGPPVPPSLIAPALESPLRIPRILHALFAVGSVWRGPDSYNTSNPWPSSCPVLIRIPNSWDLHDDVHAAPFYHDDEYYLYQGVKRVLR